MQFTKLTPNQIEQAQVQSASLWGAGCTVQERIRQLNGLQQTYPGFLEYYGLVDDKGRTLSSTKLYRTELWWDGEVKSCLGIGAVFTNPEFRGRGLAEKLLRGVMESTLGRGLETLYLWSDIGTKYYERLGFRPLQLEKCIFDIEAQNESVEVRAATLADTSAMRRIYDANVKRSRLTVYRSEDAWGFYRALNPARDYVVAVDKEIIAYFSAEAEEQYLWVDEAFAFSGAYLTPLGWALNQLAYDHGVSRVGTWQKYEGLFSNKAESQYLTKPIPMVYHRSPEPELPDANWFFSGLDHF